MNDFYQSWILPLYRAAWQTALTVICVGVLFSTPGWVKAITQPEDQTWLAIFPILAAIAALFVLRWLFRKPRTPKTLR